MEGSQQTQSQGASKQAMIYICGGKNTSLHGDNEAHSKQLREAKQFTAEAYMEVKLITKDKYLRPCKKFETGLMLFDTEVHKIVIIQIERYKGSFLGGQS